MNQYVFIYMTESQYWKRFNVQLRPAFAITDPQERICFSTFGKLDADSLKDRLEQGLDWLKRISRKDMPENPFPLAFEKLSSADPALQKKGLREFFSAYKSKTIQELTAVSFDARLNCVERMGKIDVYGMNSKLIPLIDEDPNDHICTAACRALATCGEPADVKYLIELVSDPSRFFLIREAAIDALCGIIERFGMQPGVIPCLRDQVRTDPLAVRHISAAALGELRAREAVKDLVDAILDESLGARRNVGPRAIEALGRIGDGWALKALTIVQNRDSFQIDDSSLASWFRNNAVNTAMSRVLCGDLEAFDFLIEMLNKGDCCHTANACLEKLTGQSFGKEFEKAAHAYRKWWESHSSQPREVWMAEALFGAGVDMLSLSSDERINDLLSMSGGSLPAHLQEAAEEIIRYLAAGEVMQKPVRWLESNLPYLYWKKDGKTKRTCLTVDCLARKKRTPTKKKSAVMVKS
ncbi:MAG: HEAT repeat domain-containing protein [Planctomycetota bacterium]